MVSDFSLIPAPLNEKSMISIVRKHYARLTRLSEQVMISLTTLVRQLIAMALITVPTA
jgi:hypothetical protein